MLGVEIATYGANMEKKLFMTSECFVNLFGNLYDEYLCEFEFRLQKQRTIVSRNCMNLISYQRIVPDVKKSDV